MLPTTFGSDGTLQEDRQKMLERTCFHPLPGSKPSNSPERENADDKKAGDMGSYNSHSPKEEPRFIPAPKALVQALLGKKSHQSRCVLLACSYCGRWTTERFYTKEEARLELLSESSAVHSIQNLACNSAFGQELLSAANLRKVLLSSHSCSKSTTTATSKTAALTFSTPPPLIEELLRRRSHIHIPPSSNYNPPSMLTPTLKRYLEGHMKDVMEIRTLLEANGLALPADTQEGFLLDNYFYDKGVITTSNNGDETVSHAAHIKKEEKIAVATTSLTTAVDPRIRYNHRTKGMEQPTISDASLTPSQKLRLAMHPELAVDSGEDDEDESVSRIKKSSGGTKTSSSDAFEYSKKGLALFIRNPSTFECNWQDCQEERMGLRLPSFRPEKRDPLSVHTWPTVNACLCARCGKLRLSSRFYPGCPMSFTCHLAAVPSERDCDVPESPLLAGTGAAVMAAPPSASAAFGTRRRGGRGGGGTVVAPLTLQEQPGRVKCGQYISEEDPLVESQQLHDQARAAFEAHAEKLRIEKALVDEEDAEMAANATARVVKRSTTRGKKKASTSAAAIGPASGAVDDGIHIVSDDDDDDLLLLNIQNGSATSLMSDMALVGGGQVGIGGSPVSTAPMMASTRTLQSASADSLLPMPTINPLAPSTSTKVGKTVKGGKRGRQGAEEVAAAAAQMLHADNNSSSALLVKESWVACDNCKKWRIVSREVMQHVEETGDNWYCWENKPPRRCSEAEDEAK